MAAPGRQVTSAAPLPLFPQSPSQPAGTVWARTSRAVSAPMRNSSGTAFPAAAATLDEPRRAAPGQHGLAPGPVPQRVTPARQPGLDHQGGGRECVRSLPPGSSSQAL